MENVIKKFFIWVGLAGISLFFINRLFFFSPSFLEDFAAKITYPVVWVSSSLAQKVQEATQRKEKLESLMQRYQAMKIEYLELLIENTRLKATIRYDNLSKELREFQERYNFSSMILAKIIVKNITDDQHFFLLNKGTRDGIKKDMIALYKFHLVGRVTEVFDRYCKVILITDQTCKVSAYTSQTHSQGIVRGQNTFNRCTMHYVSHLFKVVDYDLILSSGQGLVFPEGFCLGRIIHHELKDKALYHEIEIEPIINFDAIEFCLLTDQSSFKLC